ncbi:MAG: hypothetical protein DWQ01_17600 [Planctomycetota bacterium]|nr:MAG: hypothetical protein DWQ01_17600 [Planctomycetota bacterium]
MVLLSKVDRALTLVLRLLPGVLGQVLNSDEHLKQQATLGKKGMKPITLLPKVQKELRRQEQCLDKFGIDVNEAANGVFLPAETHRRLHTNGYYNSVNEWLRAAKSRDEALAALAAIREALQSGNF